MVSSQAVHERAVFGGTVTATPGQINCGKAGGPVCTAFFDANNPLSFGELSNVVLTGTPGPDSYLAGWSAEGATSTAGCTTPPQGDGSCVVRLHAPGGSVADPKLEAEATAVFEPLPPAPAVVTGAATPGANPSLATLNGTVTPDGFEIAECHFEYGPTTSYGAVVPCEQSAAEIGEGNEAEPVSASTGPLEPGTTYHYRLLASNLAATGAGADRTFTTAPAPPDGCPNAARRLEQGIAALLLPRCMALEMVSPPRKAGQPARAPVVAIDGERVGFRAVAGLAGTPNNTNQQGDHYVASRGAAGWETSPTAQAGLLRGWGRFAVSESFTPDLSCWFQVGGTASQYQVGVARAYRGCLGAPFSPFSPLLVPVGSTDSRISETIEFEAASADHARLYFKAGQPGSGNFTTAYLPGDPTPAGAGEQPNAYVARIDVNGNPSLRLLARDDGDGSVWGGNCGARVRGLNNGRDQGAVSSDGSRVYLSTRPSQPEGTPCDTANKLRILERLEDHEGRASIKPLIASECSRPAAPPCSAHDGDDLYQGASVDQSRVYFTTNRQLADSDLDGFPAAGSGDTTGTGSAAARRRISNVVTTEGSFEVGMEIAGAGIPAGATITAVDSGAATLTISASATATATGVALTATSPSCSGTTGLPGCDLYLYDAERPVGERLTQVSAGETVPGLHEAGKGAGVHDSIAAIAADGSHAYFVAAGVLTDDPGPAGGTAVAGQRNLYVWDAEAESLSFVGTLNSGDSASGLWGLSGIVPVPVRGPGGAGAGDGHLLPFASKAALTADDADGTRRDAFLYDAEADTLERVSKGDEACLPSCDNGAFEVGNRAVRQPGTDSAEEDRWASDDGETMVFQTAEALLPGDVNAAADAYLWRQGKLVRLPRAADDRPVLSADGSTVAFTTYAQLLPQDGDVTKDVYVARVNGGYPQPEASKPCAPGGDPPCRGEREAPPAPSPNASILPLPGNPPRPCNLDGKRAQKLSQRAKRLRRNAKRVQSARRARRMQRRAGRFAGKAREHSREARQCRRARRRAAR